MALSRIPLPSFTLILTSGPHSFHGYPAAIRLDSSLFPSMRPTTSDHLMRTIDLRDEPDDNIQNPLDKSYTRIDYGRIYLETIVEEEEPSASPAVDNKQLVRSTKQYVSMLVRSLRHKLFSSKNTT